jgi:glycosyltransferase involved in cell wall biosynthesis
MSGENPLYSIIITAYECHAYGVQFIEENMAAIISQTYRPIQVVISDHSKNDNIENVISGMDMCGVNVIYKRYEEHYGNPCHNWNNALLYATGDYIHYLALDDRLYDIQSVASIVKYAENNKTSRWFAIGHITEPENKNFIPRWNDNILVKNTISGPSAIVLRRDLRHIQLDPAFTYYLDLDWYYRLYKEAGVPNCIGYPLWINRRGPHQLTRTVCTAENNKREDQLLIKKYGYPYPRSPA